MGWVSDLVAGYTYLFLGILALGFIGSIIGGILDFFQDDSQDDSFQKHSSDCGYLCANGSENNYDESYTYEGGHSCDDGTASGRCSKNKPYYCHNGMLVEKPAECGCPSYADLQGDQCILRYGDNQATRSFDYVLRGNHESIELTVYKTLKEYLADKPRIFYCNPVCPSDTEKELSYIDQKEQNKHLKKLVNVIKSKTSDPDEQARIAISLVQRIPYDTEASEANDIKNRYPYEVLYDKRGVCGEKSRLLAYILRELGFGVVLFSFEAEDHVAVGIKCPTQCAYKDTGYCFIESTNPTIPTYSESDYIGVGKLHSTPEVMMISDGRSFDCLEEYTDAEDWKSLINRNDLSEDEYNRYLYLIDKYGFKKHEEVITYRDVKNEEGVTYVYRKY